LSLQKNKQRLGKLLPTTYIGIYDLEDELVEESLLFELCGYGIWHKDTLEQGGLFDVGNFLTL
jgi:hypothetical protein